MIGLRIDEGREDCGEGGSAENVTDAPLPTGGLVDAEPVRTCGGNQATGETGVAGTCAM
jgi:hypothetical protein